MEAYVERLIKDSDRRTRKLEAIAETARAIIKSWASGDVNDFVRTIHNLEMLLESLDDEDI